MLSVVKHNLGVYFMVLACLDFSLIGVCAKILSSDEIHIFGANFTNNALPAIEVVFFRNFIAAFYLLYLYQKSRLKARDGGHFGLLLFRGVAGVLSLYLLFYNIEHITLGGAYAFQKTAPIFTTLLSFFIFKESVGLRGWCGIGVGFVGVLLIAQPWANAEFNDAFSLKNSALGVLCGFFSAVSVTSARELRAHYTTEKIALAFMIVGSAIPAFSMFAGSFAPNLISEFGLDFLFCEFKMPSLKSCVIIAIMGVLGAIYQIHLTKSYGIAKKAGIVAGVSYLDVIFSLILGLFLGDKFPSIMVFAGILGIIGGGLILVFDKAKR